MNTGKVSESILKRSVLREIRTEREEITKGAGIGTDCAFFVPQSGFYTAVCTDTALPHLADGSVYSIYRVAANLAASGAEPAAVLLNLLLPPAFPEEEIKGMMRRIDAACEILHMAAAGGHTEIAETVREPVVTVTGIGQKKETGCSDPAIAPGMELVVSKWIGLEGTVILAREGKEALCTRYPEKLVREAADFMEYLPVGAEAAYAIKSGVCRMHDISRGGILGALWEFTAGAGVGLDVDLKKIPIRQETIELCEYFGLNPYEMISGGSLLMAVGDGEALAEGLKEQGIFAAVIGRLTEGNDKIIRNGEDIRFLDRPKRDEIYKFLGGMEECS